MNEQARVPEIKLPSWFLKMNSMPDDPPFSKAYGYETPDAGCFAMVYPIPNDGAMPYDNLKDIIDGIHQALGDNQGLIEVETGESCSGCRFVYSIVKTLNEPSGVQYCLTMHMEFSDCSMQIQGFFDELGTTGFRDAMVYSMMANEGLVKHTEDGIEGWAADPYDAEYDRGIPMNCSEKKEYDSQFPQHPLSEARRFIAELINLN